MQKLQKKCLSPNRVSTPQKGNGGIAPYVSCLNIRRNALRLLTPYPIILR